MIEKAENAAQDMVIAEIYPDGAMQITGRVPESELGGVQVGGKVAVSLSWNEDSSVTYDGEIVWISALADSGEAVYEVVVSFAPDANTRCGMTASVETVSEAARSRFSK